jgi:hypothetical protein
VENLESRAWLIERFGADGSRLRADIPAMLQHCHRGMAEAQERAPMKSQAVYGQIWRAVHDAVEEDFASLTTAQFYRPPSAPYKVLVVNGTALFPWRYAHDTVTDLDQASLGMDVSATRKAVLAGAAVPDMLPLGDLPTADLPAEQADEIERYRASFRETAAEHPVVVLAYASNPAALLKATWGDIKQLRADGTLEWGWREYLDVNQPTPAGYRLSPVRDDARPSFTSAPLQTPAITARPKSPEAEPSNNGPGSRG